MKYRKTYKRAITKLPQVKRFMRLVVESMGFNVGMMKSLEGKYYASLQAFEVDVVDKSGYNEAMKVQMLSNGTIDKITEDKLNSYFSKKGIRVPKVLTEFGQTAADIVNKGAREYANIDLKRAKAGQKPLIAVITKLNSTSESVAEAAVARREYILSYSDDEQHFLGLGRKGRERRAVRREDKQVRKLDKRRLKDEAKTRRVALRQGQQISDSGKAGGQTIAAGSVSPIQVDGSGGVESGGGGMPSGSGLNGILSGVSGMLGGTLGSIFGGGGAIPDNSDPYRYDDLGSEVGGALYGAEKEEKGLFKDGVGTNEILVLGLGGVLAIIAFKTLA